MSTEHISLSAAGLAMRLPMSRVWFTFPSGRLSYDCVRCGAHCCKGPTYYLGRGELNVQLATNPAVRVFVESTRARSGAADRYAVKSCQPACFFLDSANRCSIQVKHGFASKPVTCRLFPFNYLRLVDGHLVVAPHPGLCPIVVVGGSELSPQSDHAALFDQMATHGIGKEFQELPAGSVTSSIVAAEARITHMAHRYCVGGPYLRFAAEQAITADLASAYASNGENAPALEKRFASLQALQQLMAAVLDASPSQSDLEDRETVRVLAAATPAIRAELILSQGGPRHATGKRVTESLVALHLLLGLAKTAGMSEVTYQTVMRIFRDMRPLINLLACVDQRITE